MYLVKTPWLLKKLYPNLIWDANRSSRRIYLTFDDGPIPIVTTHILNILKQYNAKATFFCIGDNIKKHPDILVDVKFFKNKFGCIDWKKLKMKGLNLTSWLKQRFFTTEKCSFFIFMPSNFAKVF